MKVINVTPLTNTQIQIYFTLMSPTIGGEGVRRRYTEGQGKPDRSRLVGQVMQDDRQYVWGRKMRNEIKEE